MRHTFRETWSGLRRNIAMTVAVIMAGLLPILLGHGAGSEVMQRIAAPMVGGMLTAPLLSMLVLPAAFRLVVLRQLRVRAPGEARTSAAFSPFVAPVWGCRGRPEQVARRRTLPYVIDL